MVRLRKRGGRDGWPPKVFLGALVMGQAVGLAIQSAIYPAGDGFKLAGVGEGCCVYAETPHPNDHSGLFGRGLQGLLDTFLQIFYI